MQITSFTLKVSKVRLYYDKEIENQLNILEGSKIAVISYVITGYFIWQTGVDFNWLGNEKLEVLW